MAMVAVSITFFRFPQKFTFIPALLPPDAGAEMVPRTFSYTFFRFSDESMFGRAGNENPQIAHISRTRGREGSYDSPGHGAALGSGVRIFFSLAHEKPARCPFCQKPTLRLVREMEPQRSSVVSTFDSS